jgi:type I restriction enzyme S subunit
MMKLRPYPEYKDSGVPWLDGIPKNWRFFRGKNVFQPLDVSSKTGNEELLSVSEQQSVTPRKNVNVL